MIKIDGYGEAEPIDRTKYHPVWADETWPLRYAVLWIAWRDRSLAEKAWSEFWQLKLFSSKYEKQTAQVLTIHDSIVAIWRLLRNKSIEASASFSFNETPDKSGEPTKAEFNTDIGFDVTIDAFDWTSYLDFKVNTISDLVYKTDYRVHSYLYTYVHRADVLRIWPEILESHAPDSEPIGQSTTKTRGPGRPLTDKARRALKILRAMPYDTLRASTGDSLAADTGMSRTRAEELRKQVLAEHANEPPRTIIPGNN